MKSNRVAWRKEQLRYREILREVRSQLSRNGMCKVIRLLRHAAPEFLERDAIIKTREDAREIEKSITRLRDLVTQRTLAPELHLRLEPEHERLLDVLQAVQKICQQAEKNQPRDDQVKNWCAKIAFTLVERFSDKPPTSGSSRSPFRAIAGLLYEVLTGIPDHDLKRACDDELSRMRVLYQTLD